MGNNSFSIASLFFSIMLAIIYFSKQRVDNTENKVYKMLIIINLLVGFLACGSYYLIKYDENSFITMFINKSLLVGYILWMFYFTLYLFSISKKFKNRKKKINNVFNIISYIICIVGIVLIYALPLNYVNVPNIAYSYGPSANMLYILTIICVAVWLISVSINYKNLTNKKYIPLYLILAIGSIVVLIQRMQPELLLITYMFSFVTVIMYHTIENPDIKMINELEYAKNMAEKANRAKSDFLSSMSHEIRTPLNAIVGLSECIKNSDDIEEIHEDANDVVMASNNLLEIVNGILDISKIEADKMEIIETNYNPVELFDEVATIAKTRIGEKEIDLRCNFAEDIPNTLYGDKGKLKQIITNVLSNAVKYTEEGHIKFNVSCINERDKSNLQIIITDTGRGIKPDQIDKIFNKFERAEEDKNSTIEGTGLGLAITKSLVEMMGGKILVHSTYGEGSKFTIFIEQKYSKTESNTKVVRDEKVSYSDKRVLVVDDNKLNIKVASKVLSEFELNIDSCDSGFSAIEKIENNEHYDIIFMDIMMPKMSGVETLKKLKEIENFNTPVVALTADAMEGKSTKYIEVGFNDYLSKPINKDELKRVLNKCLSGNIEIEEEKEPEEDPHIHRIIPITDEDIEMLNRKMAEDLAKQQEQEKLDKENN